MNGGTIPSNVVTSVERLHIVFVDNMKKTVVLCELTVPFEPNIKTARKIKTEKYASRYSI